ncbi:rhodanese-like domain-containing protein [Halobacillus karajensis]|nr:rhodanese-like domain-containing protein [Halobacillus karajensis]
MGTLYIGISLIVVFLGYFLNQKVILKPFHKGRTSEGDMCVIDIRDYISAYRCPYPGAENIPLSYLPRVLKDQLCCSKPILIVSDDKRGARMAAKILRRRWRKRIYYIQS